jgi:hypothetical protein
VRARRSLLPIFSEAEALEREAILAAARDFSRMGWIFREQIASDIAVDALAEEVNAGIPTG